MDSVNKTLYIPLYGKSYVSRKGIILADPKAEQIWAAEAFPLKGKSASKWLAYYMGIRSAVFDDWVRQQLVSTDDTIVLHLGCGLDSRVLRIGADTVPWYDVDFPAVIRERSRYYTESDTYHMISGDLSTNNWPQTIPQAARAVIVMEGVSMYLSPAARRALLSALCGHFQKIHLLTDCYTELAAKLSRYRNPVHAMGVTTVYGLHRPEELENDALTFIKEWDMTPAHYIAQLPSTERRIFQTLYAGRMSNKLYRLYEYQSK